MIRHAPYEAPPAGTAEGANVVERDNTKWTRRHDQYKLLPPLVQELI